METPVVFECKGQQIVGMLHLPKGRNRVPAVLLLHGFTGTKVEPHRIFVKLSRALEEHGIASLRFDFRGCGDSAGNFEDMTIRTLVADALEATRFVRQHKRINSRRLGMLGFSLGGAVASLVAGRERTLFKTMALWAPVADGAGILDDLSTPEAVSALAQTGLTDHDGNLVGVTFIRQFAEMRPLREIVKTRSPVLMVHGTKDARVPHQQSDMYEKTLLHHKRIVKKVPIAGADHAFNKHIWEQRAIGETVDWFLDTL